MTSFTTLNALRPKRFSLSRPVRSVSLLTTACMAIALFGGCRDAEVPATAAAAEESSAAPIARLRVRVDEVRSEQFTADQSVTGTVRAFHRAMLTAEAQGRVLARTVEPGAWVEAGGVILELEASRFELELRRAEASLSAARTVLKHAERERKRGEQLRAQKAMSTQQFDDLTLSVDRARDEIALALVARDTAKRNLEDTKIVAPFAGSVDSISVDVGDFVSMGTTVATLVDLSRVRIFGGVTAREAARLVPGSTARVSFSDLDGAVFEATLESVARVASSNDGTYGIELWMADPDRLMRDGLIAQVEFADKNVAPTLVAKRAALLRRDGHPEVWVIEGQGASTVARTRRIRTGRSNGEWVEVLEGLKAGERVIWDGQFALADGVTVIVDGED